MDIEDSTTSQMTKLSNTLKEYVKLLNRYITSSEDYNKSIKLLNKKFKITPSKKIIRTMYNELLLNNVINKNSALEDCIISKSVRSMDGVLPVTITMQPDQFSCKFNCFMCPDERIENGATVDMPRSYISTEPALKRALEVDFDIVKQYDSRLNTLHNNGHIIDGCKIEINILGGTFPNYPMDYRYQVMQDIYYAANTYYDRKICSRRLKQDLQLEQYLNENGRMRIIGIIIETRPDTFSNKIIKQLLSYGVTKIQFGIQHIKNEILEIVNRQHTVEASVKAIRKAKNSGFKVVGHFMPDLPGSDPELDKNMIEQVLLGTDFQVDYIKWYPCLDVEFTEIRKWKETGRWKPYAEEGSGQLLFDVMMKAKEHSQYHIRYNRIQRDFPEENNNVVGYASKNIRTNFRQELHDLMKELGIKCKCIRCCSVKAWTNDILNAVLYIDKYEASGGTEYFINYSNVDRTILYGFVRLRLSETNVQISPELLNAALIRELHVFGRQQTLNSNKTNSVQHSGIGKKLMKQAEKICLDNGYVKVAVISGVGVREYYRKLGYRLEGTYMVKNLEQVSRRQIIGKWMICKWIFIIVMFWYIYMLC